MISLREIAAHLNAARVQAGMVTVLSFSHLHDVAVMVGRSGWEGWIYPPSVDLLMYVGYKQIEQARQTQSSRKLGFASFLLASAASVAANVIALLPHSMQGALAASIVMRIVVGVWPPLAMAVTFILVHATAPAALAPVALGLEAEPENTPEEDDTPDNSFDELRAKLGPQNSGPFLRDVITAVLAGQSTAMPESYQGLWRMVNDFLARHGYEAVKYDPVYRAAKKLRISFA